MQKNPLKNKISRRRFLAISGGLILSAAGASILSSNNYSIYRWDGFALGAKVSIQLYTDDPITTKNIIDKLFAEILRLEKIFSLYDDSSEIVLLNKQGYLENFSTEFYELAQISLKFSRITEGAFDITIQPLWEYYQDNIGTFEQAKELVGYKNFKVNKDIIQFAKPGMKVSFNSIAQGYITDKAANFLKSYSVENMLVNLGEIKALGTHPGGRKWNVALRNPNNKLEPFHTVSLRDQALSTSGAYGTKINNQVSHLFNPKTGQGVENFQSVSVIAKEAVIADAMSTAFSMLSLEKAQQIINQLPISKAIYLSNEDKVFTLS